MKEKIVSLNVELNHNKTYSVSFVYKDESGIISKCKIGSVAIDWGNCDVVLHGCQITLPRPEYKMITLSEENNVNDFVIFQINQ